MHTFIVTTNILLYMPIPEYNLFLLGGYVPMSIVTVFLIALLLAAWKAPAWVKEIGLIALSFGFFLVALSLIRHGGVVQQMIEGSISSRNVVWGGVKTMLIPVAYSLIVYIVSLAIRIIKKPSIKEIGLIVLAIGLFWIPVGLIRMTNVMNALGDASDVVIWSGIKSSMIPFACSLIVYIISLIIRIALKPRK